MEVNFVVQIFWDVRILCISEGFNEVFNMQLGFNVLYFNEDLNVFFSN